VRVELMREGAAAVDALWTENVSVGGLYVATAAPWEKNARVGLRLHAPQGIVGAVAEVMHRLDVDEAHLKQRDAGMGLQFRLLRGEAETNLKAFVAALAQGENAAAADVVKLVGLVKRFFDALDRGDALSALGLPASASLEDVHQQVRRLTMVWSTPPSRATPPQVARMESAVRALPRVEAELVALLQARAARGPASSSSLPAPARSGSSAPRTTPLSTTLSTPPRTAPPSSTSTTPLATRGPLARPGTQPGFQPPPRTLDTPVTSSVTSQESMPAPTSSTGARSNAQQSAKDMMAKAEVFLTTGMRKDATQMALQAAQVGFHDVSVCERALRVLVDAQAAGQALRFAQAVLDRHRDCARAHEVILLQSEAQDPALALRAADALCRLEPKDRRWSTAQKRLQKQLR
jgi:hypothetical protein